MKLPKDQRKLRKQARKQGWTVRPTRGEHMVWVAPTGEKVYCAATPSDHRGMRNHLARLRRAGFRG